MFDSNDLQCVVGLQQKSYVLLKWVNEALRAGSLSFGAVHEAATLSEAATDWLRRTEASLPAAVRPDENNRAAFAHLFVSYLTTSYVLREEPGNIRITARHGCYCQFCSYLASANYLAVRTPDKKAAARAREMKDLYLFALAKEIDITLAPAEREALITHPTLAGAVTYATYGTELLRRSQFASQGEGVLVLWREMAWEKGRLKKGFVLSAERILASEAALVTHLRQHSTSSDK